MAGLRACEQLRAAGWAGPLTVIGAEEHLPYNRPPLSKHIGPAPHCPGEWLQTIEFRRRGTLANVTWLLGTAVTHSDLTARTLGLADGRELRYAGLVIATGLRPRRIPGDQASSVRHVLRTVDDAVALYSQLRSGRHIVVVGAGFIGCEIAVTASSYGCRVTLIEPQPAPMYLALGAELGGAIGEFHRNNGIDIRSGVSVTAISQHRDGAIVSLSDGTDLVADIILESVGSHPNTEWLDGNGLDLDNGVHCDEHLRVIGADNAIAVGDVARFPNPRFPGTARRVEHWCIPNDSAKHGARALLAALTGAAPPESPFAPLPSFWSDQGGLRIQGLGIPSLADYSEVVRGELSPRGLRDGVTVEYRSDAQLVAIVSVNMPPHRQAAHRTALASATNPLVLPTGVST